MRIPRPKSAPGVFLWAITVTAVVLFVRVAWILVGQNIEVVSTEKGWDKVLKNNFEAIVAWLSENLFWLSVTTAAVLGGALCLWIYVLLQSRAHRETGTSPDGGTAEDRRWAAMDANLSNCMKSLGMALGEDSPMAHTMAMATVEAFVIDLGKRNDFMIPELRKDGEQAGCLRATRYLADMTPMLRLNDADGARQRAAELVPRLNAMTVPELKRMLGMSPSGDPIVGY